MFSGGSSFQATCRGLAPEAFTSGRPRAAARDGPTIYDSTVALVERASRVGPAPCGWPGLPSLHQKESISMPQAKIGVIGGSGLYQMEGMTDVEEVAVETPFGRPSDMITIGNVEGVPMAFLPRHGRGHRISPTEIPARANIWALKSLGVRWLLSISAVGSLREQIAPRDLLIPDQLFDRTKSRVNTFFEGVVVHCE